LVIHAPLNAIVYETALTKCWLGEDGIVYSLSLPGERTLANYQELFKVYDKLSGGGGQKIRLVGDISKTEPSKKEVRDYIAAELPKYVKAMALVSDSSMGREIGKFFQSLSASPYPIRVYTSLEEAVKWLKEEIG